MSSKQVTEPKLRFKTGATTIELWVLDIGQWANLAEHRSFHFHAEKSASLIYVTKGSGGYHAIEEHIDDVKTWEWIQEHMSNGIALAGQRQEDTKNPPPFLAGDLTLDQLQGIRAYWEGSIRRRDEPTPDGTFTWDEKQAVTFAQGQLDGMERTLHLIFGIDPHAIISTAKSTPVMETTPEPVQ